MPQPSLGSYGRRCLVPSPVNRMMAAFSASFREGVDVNLGVGYVNQETMPRREIATALEQVLANPATYHNALNYGSAQGSPNLIRSIRQFYHDGGFGQVSAEVLDRNDILIGASGATSILMGMALVMEPGIVIVADPMYYIYCDYLERAGHEVLAVPEDGEGIRMDLLHAMVNALGERASSVRFLFVSTVGNPTGTVVSNARRRSIVSFVLELSQRTGRRIPVAFDAAYEALIHGPWVERPVCALEYDSAGLVYEVGSFSKVLAPALRIGYLLGPHDELFDALLQNTSDMGFSAPLVVQEMAAYLIEHDGLRQVAAVRAEYARRARQIRQWIGQYLGDTVEVLSGGDAGFYYYLTLRGVATGEQSDFGKFLGRSTGTERVDGPHGAQGPRVVYVPGEYCVHARGTLRDTGSRQLRISYGYESMEQMERGIRLMGEAVHYARQASGR